MSRRHSTQLRETGHRQIRRLTQLAIGAAVFAVGSLAAFVAHETRPKASAPTSTSPAAGSSTSGSTGSTGFTGSSDDSTSQATGSTGAQAPQAPTPSQAPHAGSGGS
jgi:hypothetical protein